MKKLIALILSAFLLVGCSQKGDNEVNSNQSSVKNTSTETTEYDRKIFIEADQLKDILDDDILVAEVSWGDEKDSPDYLKSHIKNAIHINTDMIEEGPIWNLLEDKKLAENVMKLGIDADKKVVLYGTDLIAPARVAWVLKYLGVKDVKVLNGGFKAWTDKGYETEKGSVKPKAVEDFKAKYPAHPEYNLSLDQTKEKLENDKNFKLISIRSENEWLGKESGYSYIPKAGEPKGAIWGKGGSDSTHLEDYLDEDGKYKTWDQIQKMYDELGFKADDDTAFYCGTGWRAAIPWLRAYEAGIDAKIFDGGWNEWQMHDELEAQVGDPAKDAKYVKVKDLSDDKATK
ncbi:MAG: rhodanese-like domain-containing protein [Tissierellia bacterium]|nr:rhodanese-like domain-containing protein [Tissierellia bacterium]